MHTIILSPSVVKYAGELRADSPTAEPDLSGAT